jgi:hypothetical protein
MMLGLPMSQSGLFGSFMVPCKGIIEEGKKKVNATGKKESR